MSFYSAYLTVLKSVNQRTKNAHPDGDSLTNLLNIMIFPDKQVRLDDVQDLLMDFAFLEGWEATNDNRKKCNIEIGSLMPMLKEEIRNCLKAVDGMPISLFFSWINCNYSRALELIVGIGGERWLRSNSYLGRKRLPLPASEELFLTVVLNIASRFDIYPNREWYLSLSELKSLQNHEDLLDLAFRSEVELHALHCKYPGFLAQSVRSVEELSTYCQLLPGTYLLLLNSPIVQDLIPNIVVYATIYEQLVFLLPEQRMEALIDRITSVDELIMLIRSYPSYLCLLYAESANGEYVEGPCAHYIQEYDHLYALGLGNELLQSIIGHIPRLRNLITDPSQFVFDSEVQVVDSFVYKKLEAKYRKDCRLFSPLDALKRSPDPRLLTLGQAINIMQYEEGAGYYANGNISFQNDQSKDGHFVTDASKGQVLAVALASRAFEIWQQMPEEHKNCFEILECGGGEGDLCLKILLFAKAKAETNNEWLAFSNAIHYTLIELSQVLMQRQSTKLATFIAEGKVDVLHGNALNPKGYKKKAALHISNELMDMFPVEQIVIDAKGNCGVLMAVPTLTPAAYDYLLANHPEFVRGLIEEADEFRKYLLAIRFKVNYRGMVLTAERFKQLLAVTAHESFKGPANCYFFSKTPMSLYFFPRLQAFLANHQEILLGMVPGDVKIICPQLDDYAKTIHEKALVSIVIDYGDSTFKLKNKFFRSFGGDSSSYMHLYLRKAGKIDITSDVDWTVLVTSLNRLSSNAYVKVETIGGLLRNQPALPENYKESCEPGKVEELNNSGFLCLVFIGPELDLRLKHFETEEKRAITQFQLFQAVTKSAHFTTALYRLDRGLN